MRSLNFAALLSSLFVLLLLFPVNLWVWLQPPAQSQIQQLHNYGSLLLFYIKSFVYYSKFDGYFFSPLHRFKNAVFFTLRKFGNQACNRVRMNSLVCWFFRSTFSQWELLWLSAGFFYCCSLSLLIFEHNLFQSNCLKNHCLNFCRLEQFHENSIRFSLEILVGFFLLYPAIFSYLK